MDEIVLRGLAKWPVVPAVYGWLALDRRGNWLIKGERIGNPLLAAFIGRNYAPDERGCWHFQNGPQRVFVDLAYAPLVYRVVNARGEPIALATHAGQPVARLRGAWMDENGTVLLESDRGAGTVDDHDLEQLLPAFVDVGGGSLDESVLEDRMALAQQGKPVSLWLRAGDSRVAVESIASADAPRRFGFVAHPEPPAGEEICR